MVLPANKGLDADVSGKAFILGYGVSTIDTKGRVAIPADLRNAIMANSDGRSFYLAQHPEGNALAGYDEVWLAERIQAMKQAEIAVAEGKLPKADYAARREQFSRSEPVPFDTSGRFVLSSRMRRYGKLEDLAFFNGLGDSFEIFNPRLVLADPDAPEALKEDIRDALAEKGLA
jgi:MraZ protein